MDFSFQEKDRSQLEKISAYLVMCNNVCTAINNLAQTPAKRMELLSTQSQEVDEVVMTQSFICSGAILHCYSTFVFTFEALKTILMRNQVAPIGSSRKQRKDFFSNARRDISNHLNQELSIADTNFTDSENKPISNIAQFLRNCIAHGHFEIKEGCIEFTKYDEDQNMAQSKCRIPGSDLERIMSNV